MGTGRWVRENRQHLTGTEGGLALLREIPSERSVLVKLPPPLLPLSVQPGLGGSGNTGGPPGCKEQVPAVVLEQLVAALLATTP